MRNYLRSLLLLLLTSSSFIGTPTFAAESASEQADATATASPSKQEVKDPNAYKDTSEDKKSFDIPVPVGEDVIGLQVPFYGDDGQLQMTFSADVARKLDDENLEIEKLDVETFDEEQRKMNITMPKAKLNIESRVLSGKSGVVIKRDDFKLSGNEIIFHIKDRSGVITGNIEMLIYSIDQN
ncbi:MAG: hypothetical protein ACK5LK_08710 [Chthoniobacterales bacterium]